MVFIFEIVWKYLHENNPFHCKQCPQIQIFVEMLRGRKFTKPSMKPPCWCSSVVHPPCETEIPLFCFLLGERRELLAAVRFPVAHARAMSACRLCRVMSSTSFPGSLSIVTFCRWEGDPVCGWSHYHPNSRWKKKKSVGWENQNAEDFHSQRNSAVK